MLTAIVREDGNVHILKGVPIDADYLHFQMYNQTQEILTPVFKIPYSYGWLPMVKRTKLDHYVKTRKSFCRDSLCRYYRQFKFLNLVNQLTSDNGSTESKTSTHTNTLENKDTSA